MRAALLASILLAGMSSQAQYYYKDILGTRESSETIRNYSSNKVRKVVLSSFNEVNEKDKDFYVEQDFTPSTQSLKTITRSDVTNESILTTYVDANTNIIRTVDSNDAVVTITSYHYNAAG